VTAGLLLGVLLCWAVPGWALLHWVVVNLDDDPNWLDRP
jgi:hypothetical protein